MKCSGFICDGEEWTVITSQQKLKQKEEDGKFESSFKVALGEYVFYFIHY